MTCHGLSQSRVRRPRVQAGTATWRMDSGERNSGVPMSGLRGWSVAKTADPKSMSRTCRGEWRGRGQKWQPLSHGSTGGEDADMRAETRSNHEWTLEFEQEYDGRDRYCVVIEIPNPILPYRFFPRIFLPESSHPSGSKAHFRSLRQCG